MKFSRDLVANTLYINLVDDERQNKVSRSKSIPADVIFDFDEYDNLIGIEFIYHKKSMNNPINTWL